MKKIEGSEAERPETRSALSVESGTKAALKVIEDKEHDMSEVPEGGDGGKVRYLLQILCCPVIFFLVFTGHVFAYATPYVWVSSPSIAVSSCQNITLFLSRL
jgi:hypothetical protein